MVPICPVAILEPWQFSRVFFQVTGFFYGGTFSLLFFGSDGGGDLATHLVFRALEEIAPPFISITRRCCEGRLCGTSVFLGST